MDKNTSIVPKGMIQTLEESRPAMWPEAELLDAIEDGTIFNSSPNPYVAGGLAFLKRKEREEKEERRATFSETRGHSAAATNGHSNNGHSKGTAKL